MDLRIKRMLTEFPEQEDLIDKAADLLDRRVRVNRFIDPVGDSEDYIGSTGTVIDFADLPDTLTFIPDDNKLAPTIVRMGEISVLKRGLPIWQLIFSSLFKNHEPH